jgi:predicted ATP-dependent serine protease
MSKTYISLADIDSTPISRCPTGFDELDFIYGYSPFTSKVAWGMPKGKISLWAGTSGVGKSRIAIEVAKNFTKTWSNHKVLYVQTEASLEDFAGWVKNSSQYRNFYCSGESNIKSIVETVYDLKPSLIIIDSINEIEEFSTGNKKETRRIINGEGNERGLRQAVNDVGGHIILLGQLNQDGTIKGGTSLPHLVDTALNLTSVKDNKRLFNVNIGVKHRYGRRDNHIYGTWRHEEYGVVCVSNQRSYDNIWCDSHYVPIIKRNDCVVESSNPELDKFFGSEPIEPDKNYKPPKEKKPSLKDKGYMAPFEDVFGWIFS